MPSVRRAGGGSISSGRHCATVLACRCHSIPALRCFRPLPWPSLRITIAQGLLPVLTMRVLIHGFKFHDSHNARRLFGRWIADAGSELISDADLLVPVPLARWRLLSRRFNQAQILAAEAGRRTGKPVNPFALVRSRSTPHQIGLSRAQRM
jgi:hypothetical protein